MRIVSLQPFVTDVLLACGSGVDLVGTTHLCEVPKGRGKITVVTRAEPLSFFSSEHARLAAGLSRFGIDIKQLITLAPDLIIADIQTFHVDEFISWAQEYLKGVCGKRVLVVDSAIRDLEQLEEKVVEIGSLVDGRREASQIASRIKAQLMAWADSFFERCKGKRVLVLSSVKPVVVAERWFPALVRLIGARGIEHGEGKADIPLTWEDIVAARPDVIVVAPEGASLMESVKVLSVVQELPKWDDLPAVKRGDVIFCAGREIYRPGPRFLKGAAVLVSAVAGLDSGYITERDEYYKVRYLELHRHKFL